MAGAIAGTAILSCKPKPSLQTVTLTINNLCNLSCPHCYLQYRNQQLVIDQKVLDIVFRSRFQHLAIVGKEPLVNANSVALCERIATLATSIGKTVSLITNGLNLTSIQPGLADNLAYIDISLDGGPETYQRYRRGSLTKLRAGLEHLRSMRFRNVNALHVLNDVTIHAIDDMIQVTELAEFKIIMYSPYLQTLNEGTNSVNEVSIESLVESLASSDRFMKESRAFLLLDSYHLRGQGISFDILEGLLNQYQLREKVRIVRKDPLHYGIIRVTYDGLALPPYESIHPSLYREAGQDLLHRDYKVRLEDVYRSMLVSHRLRRH